MSSLSNPNNFALLTVVLVFWCAVVLVSRANGRPTSGRLLVMPAFFILIGMTMNLYYSPWGTYMVAFIHVLMLPALSKIAKRRP